MLCEIQWIENIKNKISEGIQANLYGMKIRIRGQQVNYKQY